MNDNPIYLVPYDFTPVADNAVNAAFDIAEHNDGIVYLLHIAERQSESVAAKNKIKEVVKNVSIIRKQRIRTKVLVGDLYDDIGKVGALLDASLIVMGTHGAVGIQKIFGSKAVKMISKSSTPFLIVQSEQSFSHVDTIVMPFSFDQESIQILNYLERLAKDFRSTIHLVGYHESDAWLKGKVKANQLIARRALIDAGVRHEIVNLPKKAAFEKELLDYSMKVNADIIATTFYKKTVLPPPNTFIQEIIENQPHIPVITINADETSLRSNLSFMSV
ncbi:MAG: nucleotide-binding universal stress UspA family protein [Flavobacteriaceae bacterium]|jgi:nucleotide-binding universal stress UspA family protein